MINLHKHIRIAIIYFFLVAIMGVLMRFNYVTALPFNHKYMLHAHSHVAILGWLYLGLTTLVYKIFLAEAKKPKHYKRIFFFTNLSILGMLIAFPFQGYALYSIIFSTLFLFASYAFTWFAIKYIPEHFKKRFSWKIIKTGLWYLVISSVGPWAIGAVMATLGNESVWYKTSIYLYLHFQYNGWFIFALLGMLFYILEENNIHFPIPQMKSFLFLLNTGVLLSFFLSVLWFEPPLIFYLLGVIGALVQGLAFYELHLLLKPHYKKLMFLLNSKGQFLLKIGGSILLIKIVMQILSGHPFFANLAFHLKDFIIGYLHLVFLGMVIPVMLVFLDYFKLIRLSKPFIYLFLFTVLVTELLIFYRGLAIWWNLPQSYFYFILLASLSILFPFSVGIFLFQNFKTKTTAEGEVF